jgi:hypothetical protein
MAMIVVVLARTADLPDDAGARDHDQRRVRGILEHCVGFGAAEVADGAVVQLAAEGLIAIGQSLGMRIVLLIISEPDSAQASVKG